MTMHNVRSYIWSEVETMPPGEMEKLQVERLRAGVDRVSQTVPWLQEQTE